LSSSASDSGDDERLEELCCTVTGQVPSFDGCALELGDVAAVVHLANKAQHHSSRGRVHDNRCGSTTMVPPLLGMHSVFIDQSHFEFVLTAWGKKHM
jgi:hypothetical protein